jgi:type I restriction enzyme S subunit
MNTNLPKGWDQTTIGNSLKLRSGNFLSATSMDPDGRYPVYGGNGINGYHSAYMFEERKIVLGRVGVYCGAVHYTLPNSWVTDNALYVAEKDPRFLDDYLVLALRHANLNQYASQFGQPLISQSRLKDVKILIPPISEQKRIAAILSKADRLRRLRRYARELSDGYLGSVFLEMFGDPVTNPMGWEVVSLERLLASPPQNGLYLPQDQYVSGDSKNGVEMVHMSDLFYEIVRRGKLKRVEIGPADIKKYSVTHNDLLIARRSLNFEGAAKPCLIPRSSEPLVFESSMMRITLNQARILPIYLFHYLSNERAKKARVIKYVTQSTISGINQDGVKRLEILIAPLPLQQNFAQIVRRFERLRAQQREAERQAEHLFGSLLHRAFRGEV